MLPFLCPSNALQSYSVTPAARSLLPKVCFRSGMLIRAKPSCAGRNYFSCHFFAALTLTFFQAESFLR